MIFRTITDESTGATKSIGLFGKSIRELQNTISSIKSQGIINTFFNASSIDHEAIQDYNQAIKNGIEPQKALEVASKGTNNATIALIESAKGGTVSIEALTAAQKSSTLAAKAGSVALKALSVAGNMLAMWAISEAISGLYKLSQVSKDVAKSAKELGESFSSAKSDIDDYKSKISELYDTINDSNSSIEDVTNARQTLMSVQDELIDKFGTEKETIELITSAINNQSEALDTLTEKQWQVAKNDFNKGDFWNDVGNWASGYEDNIDRMVSEMENVTKNIYLESLGSKNGVYIKNDELIRALEKAGYDYVSELENFHLSGTLEDVYSDILNIQQIAQEHNAPKEFLNALTKEANNAKQSLDDYGEMWDSYILRDRIFANENLADSWHEVTEAYLEYEKAFTSGNQDAIEKSIGDFSELMKSVLDDSDIDESVKDYFENMYPALKTEVDKWEFHAKILPEYDTHSLNGKNKADILGMLQQDGMQNGEETFNSILNLASKYGIVTGNNTEKINKLLDLLVEWGILQDSINDSAAEYPLETEISITFDQAWADSFTSEDDAVKELGNSLLELAEQGRLTIETFNEADSTEYFKNLGISADEAVAKINRLVDESKQLSSMSSQISSMADALGTKQEDGFVSADTLSGFDVEVRGLESWDRFQEVLGSTTSSYEECQEAANALATEWVNSSDFLAQLTEQNREYYATQLEAMGIENYEEVITYAQALNEAKETLAQSSLMLGEATQDEIEALIAEGQYSELTANMILALYDAKVAEQAATIDTSADCANLIALAGDTDRTSKSIELLIQLMNIYKNLESGVYDNNEFARTGALAVATGIKAQLEAIANGETKNLVIEPTVKLGSKGKSSAKSAGKEAGKSLKDGLKEELSDLEGIISSLSKAIDGQKEVISSQKEVALEAIESQISALEEERDARLAVIEAEKAQLEAQIKAIDKQIKSKQKEIDAINDAAKARQHEIDLQKAQFELEKMQNQRTLLVNYMPDTIVI